MAQSISWAVVEQRFPGGRMRLISKHAPQEQAEAERDRRNSDECLVEVAPVL